MFDCLGIQVLDIHHCEDMCDMLNSQFWNGFKWGLIVTWTSFMIILILMLIESKLKKNKGGKNDKKRL